MGCSGHLILTNKRVLEYKNRLQNSIPLEEVVDVELRAHPGGYVVTSVISATAQEYAAFSNSPGTDAGMKYWDSIIQTYLNDARMARHVASLIMGEASRTQT
jgi:hypothetical protein